MLICGYDPYFIMKLSMSSGKTFIRTHPKISWFLLTVHNILFGRNGFLLFKRPLLSPLGGGLFLLNRVRIHVSGINNKIIIGDYCFLKSCNFSISGNNNIIEIKDGVFLNDVTFVTENDNNRIVIGESTSIHGKTELAAIESTNITIGEDCMFSSQIYFRTGDSHSIIDDEGRRINPSESISVGNHVWIGQQVAVLKGSNIPSNSIVGYKSLVTKKHFLENTIYAGIPTREIKTNVNWLRERI